MTDYDQLIERAVGTDALVPEPMAREIIQDMPKASSVLSLARQVPMSTKTNRHPVLSVLPKAYFVNGDTGLKKTSKVDWENTSIVAEELAVIIPIPEAYLDDSAMDIWGQVRPLVVEAFGAKLDEVCLFGVDKPDTWGPSVYQSAVAGGNNVVAGTGVDLGVDVAMIGQTLAESGGGNLSGFAAAPGTKWRFAGVRSGDGVPIFQQNLQEGPRNLLYGEPFQETLNGAWDADEAIMLAGDWRRAVVGIRQDITFKIFTEGVITDDSGNIVMNLMQQDAVALRAVFRAGWQLDKPATRLDPDRARSPFGVLQTTTATAS